MPGHWEADLLFGRHVSGRHPGRTLDPVPAAGRPAREQRADLVADALAARILTPPNALRRTLT
ncbi:hypothetical protein [Nocardia tengchongensis]|uniref:hypothetical protein n=1 Tax=Nocardia tengchongensis TaxID=2055889 RepID=UPI003610E284